MLAYHFESVDSVFVVSERRVDLYLQKTRRTLFNFQQSNHLVFAKFLSVRERQMLLIIDKSLQVYLFDLAELKNQASSANGSSLRF